MPTKIGRLAGIVSIGDVVKHRIDQLETVRHETPKVGRNDDCPCGSGKKFKKCCGAETA